MVKKRMKTLPKICLSCSENYQYTEVSICNHNVLIENNKCAMKKYLNKKCSYNIAPMGMKHIRCPNNAIWEVKGVHMDWNARDMDGEIIEGHEFIVRFCDKHFIKCGECGNLLQFREIGTQKWEEIHEYDLMLDVFVRERNIREYIKQLKIRQI